MKTYTVHKGVEAPLKIWGMIQRYFYIYSIVGAVVIAITIGVGMASVRSDFRLGRVVFIITLALSILIVLRLFFITKSGRKVYRNGKVDKMLSNADITKLKRKNL